MTKRILKYVIFDVMRSKIVLIYMILLFLLTSGFVYMQNDPSRTVVSLQYIILTLVPLISIILGTIHYYNSREFIELVMTQPIQRRSIYLAEYLGLSLVLSAALFTGLGIPLIINGITAAGAFLIIAGILLTFVFTGLAFLASVYSNDKARGIGLSLILWFYFAILYDGIVLAAMFYFSDYPLEKPMLFFTALNPIDLSRILIIMKTDMSALMGYTGALYQKFFGTGSGTILAIGCMLLWVVVPVWLAARKFRRKDF